MKATPYPRARTAALIITAIAISAAWWIAAAHHHALHQTATAALITYCLAGLAYAAWALTFDPVPIIERILKAGLCFIAIHIATGTTGALIALLST